MSTSGGANESVTVVPLANPAAGADWSFTLTQAGVLVAARAQLTTSAVVGNRSAILGIRDSVGHLLAEIGVATVQPANNPWTWTWAGSVYSTGSSAGRLLLPLPAISLPVGGSVGVSTANLDVADQWSVIVLTFSDR